MSIDVLSYMHVAMWILYMQDGMMMVGAVLRYL